MGKFATSRRRQLLPLPMVMSRSRVLRKLHSLPRTKTSALSDPAMSGCARASRRTVPWGEMWTAGAACTRCAAASHRGKQEPATPASPMQTVSPDCPDTARKQRRHAMWRSATLPSTAVGPRHNAPSGKRRKRPGQTPLKCADTLRQRVSTARCAASTARKNATKSTFSPGQNDSARGRSVGRVGLEPTADGL